MYVCVCMDCVRACVLEALPRGVRNSENSAVLCSDVKARLASTIHQYREAIIGAWFLFAFVVYLCSLLLLCERDNVRVPYCLLFPLSFHMS